jgi:hypothetical protein
MVIKTKAVFAVAALVVTAGVGAVEISRNVAKADDPHALSATVEVMQPETEQGLVSVATTRVWRDLKGDLPVPLDCAEDIVVSEAECVHLAYTTLTEPSFVVASSFGNTTTLLRVDASAIGDVIDDVFGARNEAGIASSK